MTIPELFMAAGIAMMIGAVIVRLLEQRADRLRAQDQEDSES